MLDNHLGHVESLSRQIGRVDEEIRSRASLDEDVRLLHHNHLVGVGSASLFGVVGVEVLYDGSEGCPVYLGVCFGEFVA